MKKWGSFKNINFRWLSATLLAFCIFLPLAKTSDELLQQFNNQVLVVEFYDDFMLTLKDNDLKLDFRFWTSGAMHMIILFIWPLLFLPVENCAKNRFLKYTIIAIEIGLSLYTLLFAFTFLYLLLVYGSFHIGSILALTSFSLYLTASIISMVKSRKKKPDSKWQAKENRDEI